MSGSWMLPLGLTLLLVAIILLVAGTGRASRTARAPSADSVLDDALAYSNRGLAYLARRDLDRAIAAYDRAIALKPDYTEAYSNRGLVYAAKRDIERAIPNYDRITQLRPCDPQAYLNRGNTYNQKGDHERAIALDPDDAKTCYLRGGAYCKKGAKDRAIADFGKVLELSDDLAVVGAARKRLEEPGAS